MFLFFTVSPGVFLMFPFGEYLRLVCPQVAHVTSLQELKDACTKDGVGAYVELGTTPIIDTGGRYVINVSMCNSRVVPRPDKTARIMRLHDMSDLTDLLRSSAFPVDVRTHGNKVVSFTSAGETHAAFPDLQSQLRIADALGVRSEMISCKSLNAAIHKHIKNTLPRMTMMPVLDIDVSQTAFMCQLQEESGGWVRCLDVRRCYTSAITKDMGAWAHFSILDEVEQASEPSALLPGMYYVQTTNYFPLKGSGWYHHTLLKYARSAGIRFEVKFAVKATHVLPPTLFRPCVESITRKLDPSESKLVINSFIGMLKTKPSSSRSAAAMRTFVTKCKEEALLFLSTTPGSFCSVNDELFMCRYEGHDIQATPSTKHIYNQIIERSWILVHELARFLESHGGRILSVKTDAVTAEFPHELDFPFPGEYREETPPQRQAQYEVQHGPEPTAATDPVPQAIDISWQWDGEPFCLLGRAGTGKTSKIAQIVEQMSKCVVVSPTNRASSLFKDGMTIHKLFGITDINSIKVKMGRLLRIRASYDVLVVDEVFMCCEWMLEGIYQLRMMGMKVILSGDPFQLPPVDGKCLTPKSTVLRKLVSDRLLFLAQNLRCNTDLSGSLAESVQRGSFEIPVDVVHTPFDPLLRRHLTYTNRCSERINTLILKHAIRRNRSCLSFSDNEWSISKASGRLKRTAILLTRNTPLLIAEACRYGMKNKVVTVERYTHENVMIDGIWHPISKDLFLNCTPVYALTVHRAQGTTINERYQVHEIEKMRHIDIGPRLLYVALTRGTYLHYVQICQTCHC